MPPKEVLLARMLGSLNAPVSNFVGVLSAIVSQLVYVLKAIENKKREGV
jgi:large subunit ribosomal protein L10